MWFPKIIALLLLVNLWMLPSSVVSSGLRVEKIDQYDNEDTTSLLRNQEQQQQRRDLQVQAKRIGNDGRPSSSYPLGKCESDCDNDDDCDAELFCFKRRRDEEVPGCTGVSSKWHGDDFCIDPADQIKDIKPNTVARVGNNGKPKSLFPLAKCLGDCDRDSDCAGSLKCYQRSRGDGYSVPGCIGIAEDSGTDFCYDPDDDKGDNDKDDDKDDNDKLPAKQLARIGNDREPSSVYPLPKCRGDCDSDRDCAGRLQCFQRGSSTRKVPGCDGNGDSIGTDYCYDPDDDVPAPSPGGGGGGGRDTPLSDEGDNWRPSNAYPLDLCEGDCDGDFDCKGNLVCHHRDGRDPVPSCAGVGIRGDDYCIHPSDESARPPEAGAFRLKMYWEEGYRWQEVFWEEEWCIICRGGGRCNEGDSIQLSTCDDDVTWFVFENLDGDRTQFRIAKTNYCLELDDRDARAKPCQSSSTRQLFSPGQGSFTGRRFELETVSKDGCMSNNHHPREGERVYRQSCGRARYDKTSYYIKY